MSQKHVQTISTRLEVKSKEGQELVEFFDHYGPLYGQARNVAFKLVKVMPQHEVRKIISARFGINSRMADSAVRDAIGIYNAHLALMKENRSMLNQKIRILLTKINKLEKKLRYANYKKQIRSALYKKRQRLNRLRQKLQHLEYKIQHKIVSVCFGTRKLFKRQYTGYYKTHEQWKKEWRKARSSYFKYVGEKAKKCGNELCQFQNNRLKIRVLDHYKNGKSKYISIDCQFRIDLSKYFGKSPLTYQFIRRDRKYYVYVMITLDEEVITSKFNGTIGLDYNKGFITLCETDKQGNIVHFDEYLLKHHGTGNKAKTEIEQTLHEIVQYSKSVGKNIIYESLDFKMLKFKCDRNEKDKSRNRDLHLFDYSRYNKTLANIAYRLGVGYELINPAYISIIGEALYSKSKGINRHMAAAYVIARIGQGYNDVLKHPELKIINK